MNQSETTSEKKELCARCQSPNALSRTHCELCGARLPWLPPSVVPVPVLPPSISSVKCWPLISSESQKLQHALAGVDDFFASQSCLGSDKRSGLAIDERARKGCLLKIGDDHIERRVFLYSDILGAEVIEDGYIIASTSGRGAGKPSSHQPPRGWNNHTTLGSCAMVAFKLILNAVVENPAAKNAPEGEAPSPPPETLIHIVRFLHKKTPRESQPHKNALTKAHDWQRTMMTLIEIMSIKSPSRR